MAGEARVVAGELKLRTAHSLGRGGARQPHANVKKKKKGGGHSSSQAYVR